jgi:hypothetical protein
MSVLHDTSYCEPDIEAKRPVLVARPVGKRNMNYKARVRELKEKYPKILARLAE